MKKMLLTMVFVSLVIIPLVSADIVVSCTPATVSPSGTTTCNLDLSGVTTTLSSITFIVDVTPLGRLTFPTSPTSNALTNLPSGFSVIQSGTGFTVYTAAIDQRPTSLGQLVLTAGTSTGVAQVGLTVTAAQDSNGVSIVPRLGAIRPASITVGGGTSTCVDSDPSNDPNVAGYLTISGSRNNDDVCDSSNSFLDQWQCNSFGRAEPAARVSCTNGCLNGRCNPAPSAVCGNGIVEVGEQCDHGAQCDDRTACTLTTGINNCAVTGRPGICSPRSGDGCSATCQSGVETICNDAQDNDGDSLIDCADTADCNARACVSFGEVGTCDLGSCIICSSNFYGCVNNELRRCNPTGTAFITRTPCGTQICSVVGGAGGCVSCEPNTYRCGVTGREQCQVVAGTSPVTTNWETANCPAGESCRDGECAPAGSCSNGATNPPTCTQCSTGQQLVEVRVGDRSGSACHQIDLGRLSLVSRIASLLRSLLTAIFPG